MEGGDGVARIIPRRCASSHRHRLDRSCDSHEWNRIGAAGDTRRCAIATSSRTGTRDRFHLRPESRRLGAAVRRRNCQTPRNAGRSRAEHSRRHDERGSDPDDSRSERPGVRHGHHSGRRILRWKGRGRLLHRRRAATHAGVAQRFGHALRRLPFFRGSAAQGHRRIARQSGITTALLRGRHARQNGSSNRLQ